MTVNSNADVASLLRHFNAVLGASFKPPADLLAAAQAAIVGCRDWEIRDEAARTRQLVALINGKLKLNKDRLQAFLDAAAEGRVFPNYHDKAEILHCLDHADGRRFRRWLRRAGASTNLAACFDPVTHRESLESLLELLRTGTVNRSDARDCGVEERQTEILRSLFGSYVFHAYPAEAMHGHFNPDSKRKYLPDFYAHLLAFQPQVLHRECALIYLRVTRDLVKKAGPDRLRDALFGFVRDAYARLSNHCVLAVQIEPFREGGEDGQWRLFSDLVLYAEKHREVPLEVGYFRPREIERVTAEYVPGLDTQRARFDLANEGFFYRDCFLLMPPVAEGECRPQSGDLLLLFDKNARDETVIPCPGCRSANVAGNSYPALGVRSWECRNPVCPDRSAFDRGHRYSLASIIKQEAIKSDADQIPEWSLRRWKLDVVPDATPAAVADMLVRHYSLHGDRVVFVNCPPGKAREHGRRVAYEPFGPEVEAGLSDRFQGSALFHRFVVERRAERGVTLSPVELKAADATLYHGDCFEVLSALAAASVDGAVTSPPYYNARSYSTWPNIYCYLYDMYNSARAVFRSLKPGGYYVFNIFDYFDNENSVVLSAMGKKRMTLGAYIVDLFRRAGFALHGNVAWRKGEVEGKRNYNQGNRSPYYQAPLNCWEHCFVFRKPGGRDQGDPFPTILDAKPVYKIVRGENVLGHTAPFPPAVPELLIRRMAPGQCILDPYAGSLTTARTAWRHKIRSVSVELQEEYCRLGVKLLEREVAASEQRGLFDLVPEPTQRPARGMKQQAE